MTKRNKQYDDLQSLKMDWFTIKDLITELNKKGYIRTVHSIRRWEKEGLIPQAKRATVKSRSFRIYKKDGSDFAKILGILDQMSYRVIKVNSLKRLKYAKKLDK